MRCLVTALLRGASTRRQLLRLTAVSTSALQQRSKRRPGIAFGRALSAQSRHGSWAKRMPV